MVKLRLTRIGKKHSPFYRVVAVDSKKSRDGKFLEVLGHYDPTKEPKVVNINSERAKYWLSVGAIPTETVRYLLVNFGGIELAPKKIATPKAKLEAKSEEK